MESSRPDERRPTATEEAAFLETDLGPRDLLVTNDDEIVATTGPAAPHVVPLPTLDGLDDEQLAEAARRGRDRLAARDDQPDLSVPEVLGLRRSWLGLLLVEQRSALGVAHVGAYLRADGYAVLEDARADGVHRFVAARHAAAVDSLVVALSPFDDDADADADVVTVPRGDWAAYAASHLAEVRIASTVLGLRNHLDTGSEAVDERRVAVYAMPGRTLVVDDDGAGGGRVQQVSRRTLARALRAAVGATGTPAGPGRP